MKNILFFCFFFTLTLPALAQYVPKEKREQPKDTLKPTPTKPTQPKTTQPKEREPLEQKFIGYAMAFPSFLPGSFRLNGGTATLNVGYRITERINFGLTTNYGYQQFPAGSLANTLSSAFVRNYGIGVFAEAEFIPNYFVWAEYANLNLKAQINNTPPQVEQLWYGQPLVGLGGKFPRADGRRGFSSMILLNPRAIDQNNPQFTAYPLLVTRFLFYFHF